MILNSLRFATFATAILWAAAAIPGAAAAPAPAAASGPATTSTAAPHPVAHDTYSDDEVAKAASDFFSTGAKELSDVLAKVLRDKGHPVAIIRGEEAGGAIGVGESH